MSRGGESCSGPTPAAASSSASSSPVRRSSRPVHATVDVPASGLPDQPGQDVLAQGPPGRGLGDDARLRGREPAQARGVVAGVQAGAGALLHRVLVELLPQRRDRVGAAGVGVGQARGERASGRVDRDQRGGEGVHRDAGDAGPQPRVAGHRVEDLLDLRGHLVGVDDRGAVGRDREGVRHLVLQAVDPPARRVVHAATGGGGPDVQREDQRVQRRVEGDVVVGPGHRSPRRRRRGSPATLADPNPERPPWPGQGTTCAQLQTVAI